MLQVLGATLAALSTLGVPAIGVEGGADFSGDDIGSEDGVDIGAEGNADVLVRAQNTLTPLSTHTHTLTVSNTIITHLTILFIKQYFCFLEFQQYQLTRPHTL